MLLVQLGPRYHVGPRQAAVRGRGQLAREHGARMRAVQLAPGRKTGPPPLVLRAADGQDGPLMGELVGFPGDRGGQAQSEVVDYRGQLRKPLRPGPKTKAAWKREGQRREDPGYAARWTAFWSRTVKAVAALGSSVNVADMFWVEEYVRRCRLAELHEYEAIQDPYQTYESGYVAAHPGFAQSRAEAKFARILASDLGLTPTARREAGLEVPRPHAAGWVDDQTGADGQPL